MCWKWAVLYSSVNMSSSEEDIREDLFKLLMNAITCVKNEMETKFASSIEELQRQVTASQESSSAEVVTKLRQRAYRFRKKGNEA